MKLDPQEIKSFQKKILDWYKENKRDLPWRYDRDAYHILISEVMLQQTQVGRVIPKYYEWLRTFPTIQSLAKASTRDVLFHWSGLGYNKRALYLKKTAEELVIRSRLTVRSKKTSPSPQSSPKRRRRSRSSNLYWPQTEKELRKLPGIGEYTARAILCFAFNKQVAVVDTNVRKVILTHFGHQFSVDGSPKKSLSVISQSVAQQKNRKLKNQTQKTDNRKQITEKEIQNIADKLLPEDKAYEWNQALMDYAAAELKNHKILIPRQSPFKDSDRYYRGQIVKLLLKKRKIGKKILKKELTDINNERLEKIIAGLEKDDFLEYRNSWITLK